MRAELKGAEAGRQRGFIIALIVASAAPSSWAEPSPEAQQHFANGVELKAAKQYWEAAAELEAALALDSEYLEACWVGAWVYSHLSQGLRAVALFQQFLRLEPTGERADEARAAIRRKSGGFGAALVLKSEAAPRQRRPSVGPVPPPQPAVARKPPPKPKFPRPQGLPPLGDCLFEDHFANGRDKWQTIGGTVDLEDGALCIKGGKEGDPFPVAMIKQQFDEPRLAVEFVASPMGKAVGDVGINLGGYIVSLGGWGNTRAVLFKLVDGQMKELASRNVALKPGRTYHCLLIRDGAKLAYYVNGKPLLRAEDPEPITGDDARRVLALTYFERHVHYKHVLVYKLP